MNTNLFSQAPAPDAIPAEARGLTLGAIATFLLAVRQYLKRKAASKSEHVSRAVFDAQVLTTQERLHTNQLAVLEKLDVNHWELLAALVRLATRISALEAGFARLDERTRK